MTPTTVTVKTTLVGAKIGAQYVTRGASFQGLGTVTELGVLPNQQGFRLELDHSRFVDVDANGTHL